nr:11447_t:CDS:2 [Entrophospora candida]
MESKILSSLSQDYLNLLESEKCFDVIINVGKEPNLKKFNAHSLILHTRSPYFRAALSKEWVSKQDDDKMIFNKPNISSEVFEVILKQVSSKLCLAEHDASVILDILRATDEFCMDELSEYIQDYLIENPWRLLSHFVRVHRFASEEERYPKIRKCVIEIIKENPATIFDSSDFVKMEDKTLFCFLKYHNFNLKPIVLWKHILEWGLAQPSNSCLPPSSSSSLNSDWSENDFKLLGNSLKPFLPLIPFTKMSADEIVENVRPWMKSLDAAIPDFYKEIYNYHFLPESDDLKKNLPDLYFTSSIYSNNGDDNDIFDSQLATPSDLHLIMGWVDSDYVNKYNLKLLLRGSRDGFTLKKFHSLCDVKGPTLIVLRVESTGEILGGYSPKNWYSNILTNYSKTTKSFIFSLGDKVFKFDPILSRVTNYECAIFQSMYYGPCFGGGLKGDLKLAGENFKENSASCCIQHSYESSIRSSEDGFSIDEYEVFQIVEKKVE